MNGNAALTGDNIFGLHASYVFEVSSLVPQPHTVEGWHWGTAQSVVLSACSMFAFWVLLVGGVHRDEVIVGCVGVVAATAMLRLVTRASNLQLRFLLRDVLPGALVPWNIVKDASVVIHVLLQDVFLRVQPRSVYGFCEFKTSQCDPEDVARRVLVTAYASASPNTIILGIDSTRGCILFHQLQNSEPDKIMRKLGARS